MNFKMLKVLSILIYISLSITLAGYYVSFKSEVSVFPGAIFISELISDTDLPTNILEKIIVGYLPSGGQLSLNKRYLLNLIKRIEKAVDSDIDDVPVVIRADKNFIVREPFESRSLTTENATELIFSELYNYYPRETKFVLKRQSGNFIEHDNFSLSVQISNKLSPFVKITLKKSNRTVGYITFQYEAQLFRKIAVAKRKINKDEIISFDVVEFIEYNVYSLNKWPIFTDDLPVMADKVFQKGEIIDSRYIKDIPILLKGQITKAYTVISGITASTLVQALENGYVGNTITVKNIDSGVILKGIVRPDGTIIILEVK